MKFISLGMGVQSTALYFMSSMGELPRVDAAIFADLGREKTRTLKYLDFLMDWQLKNDGLPIVIIRKKNLYKDLLNGVNSTGQRWSSIPAYTRTDGSKEEGMLRRQCTNEYKIEQVDRAIREYCELPTLRGQNIEVWKGITVDEWDRISEPEQAWKTHVYPFVGYEATREETKRLTDDRLMQMTRQDIVAWYNRHGLPVPPKSSCVFCPYQSDAAWIEMKENHPDDFDAACQVDEAIRDSTKKGIKQQAFLHDSLVPLRDVKFSTNTLWRGECSGNCHI